jgi:predicted porin
MKKKLLAVAVVGALASPVAFAQTLYGIIDLGYQNLKHADGDINKDFIHQGMHSGSRLGVRGSEDLMGGTYAMYQIEFDITADTGDTPANGMTNRLTMVGLGSKAWGELTLGRQYTHTFHTFAVGSAAAYGTFGSSFLWNAFIPSRASNSVKYSSPSMGGFSVGALWSPSTGGASGAASTEPIAPGTDTNYWDAAVRYAPGPFGVALSYGVNTAEAAGVETDTNRTQLSANWDNRAFGIYGNVWNQETEGATTTEDRTGWSVSGVARFGGRHEIYLVYGQQEDDIVPVAGQEESTVVGIAYQHVMSKRTRVYVGYQDVDNDPGANRSVNFSATGVANGFDPRAFQLGLVHTF